MNENDDILKKQLASFSKRAESSGIFIFSDFLTLAEQEILFNLKLYNAELFGGAENCERKIAKFGLESENGYDMPYPIVCIEAAPKGEKFADELSHRDFLGAVMNLGIERDTIGDIFVKENRGYIFALARVSDFICDNLFTVSHTAVSCKICDTLPDALKAQKKSVKVNVASERADAVCSAIFRFSRAAAAALFKAQRVMVNGRLFLNGSRELTPGDSVSVRGFGKFIYCGIEKETKKGRLFVNAEIFITEK